MAIAGPRVDGEAHAPAECAEEKTVQPKVFLIFLTLAALFCFSMFHRALVAVISPDLMRDLSLDAEKLGILGAVFFYAFALVQLPLGPLLDRFSPGLIMGLSSLIAGAGVLLFGISESFLGATIGRILVGAGMACVLMGSLKVFTMIFPKQRFATVSGLFIAVGTLGSFLATSPLAWLDIKMGWRMTLLFFGLATMVLGLAVFSILRSIQPKKMTDTSAMCGQGQNLLQTVKTIAGSLSFWQISALAFCQYGTYIALQGLWLGLYLIESRGYSAVGAGHILAMLVVGNALGSLCAGWLSDRVFSSKKVASLFGLGLYCLSMIPLLGILPLQGVIWDGMIHFSIGFFRAFGVLLYGHVKDLYPMDLAGTAMTWVNFFVAAGGAFFMHFMGKVIEIFPRTGQIYSQSAYHAAFRICFVSMAASLVFYAFSRKEMS